MPFQPGNKLARGGKRPGAGHPTKERVIARETLREAIERLRDERAAEISATYFGMAASDPATMRHLIDKAIPDKAALQPAGITVNVVQFDHNQHSISLHTQELPAPVLAGNGERDNAGGEDMASEERQGQNRLEFRYSLDVTPQGDILPPVSNVRPGEKGNLGRDRQDRLPSAGALPKPANKKQKRNRATD